MLRFSLCLYRHAARAAACLLVLSSLAFSQAHAQDGFVSISDLELAKASLPPSFSEGKIQRSSAVQPTSCDLEGCDTCCDCGDACCDCRPWWAHRSSVWGEFLYLHATDTDVAHAQQQAGLGAPGGAGTVPFGRIGTVDPHHEPAFRVGLNKAFTDCTSLDFSYTFYESDAIDAINIPAGVGGGLGAVGSFVHHPNTNLTASTGPVLAAYDIDFQLAEFSYRALWKASDRYAINWSLGARYGHLEEDFIQQGIFAGSGGGTVQTLTNVDFDGGGIKFGLDGERRIGCRGFSFYGRTSISPLSGTIQADYNQAITTGAVQLANAVWKDDRIITLLDYEAGLAWTGAEGRWRASVGYTAAFWFNHVTTNEFINAVQTDNYDNAEDTLKFEGATARIERRW